MPNGDGVGMVLAEHKDRMTRIETHVRDLNRKVEEGFRETTSAMKSISDNVNNVATEVAILSATKPKSGTGISLRTILWVVSIAVTGLASLAIYLVEH